MKFICIEKGAHTHGANDQENWFSHEPARPLLEISGETEDEVRKKLNAYLTSSEGIGHYGVPAFEDNGRKHLKTMEEGSLETKPELALRNGHYWWWSFAIVEWSDGLIHKPATLKVPVLEYESN